MSKYLVYQSPDGPKIELKGLHHHVQCWEEQGHPEVRNGSLLQYMLTVDFLETPQSFCRHVNQG